MHRLEKKNTTRHHPDKHLNSSFGFSLDFCTHRSLSVNITSLLIPVIPLLPFTLTSVWAATNSSLTCDVPERQSKMWRCPERLSEKCWKGVCFIFEEPSVAALKRSLSPRLSLITTPSSPHLSVLITANPSPRWTATHLWCLQRITQILSKHTHFYSHNTYLLFLISGVLFTVKRFDFHPVFTCLCCCVAAHCGLRQFFSIARACCCSELSPWGRQSATEAPHTWNTRYYRS